MADEKIRSNSIRFGTDSFSFSAHEKAREKLRIISNAGKLVSFDVYKFNGQNDPWKNSNGYIEITVAGNKRFIPIETHKAYENDYIELSTEKGDIKYINPNLDGKDVSADGI